MTGSSAADQVPLPDRDSLLAAIERSIDRACAWLTARIGGDGQPAAEHCHYYRLPWALALVGRRRAASAVLSWIERDILDDQGDLRAPTRAGFNDHWSSYPLAIIASGAWHLERYDTADLIAKRLTRYQHPESGGALAAHPDSRRNQRQDLFPTAQLGMTGITTGHTHLSHLAFAWFQHLHEAQPELPARLYTATDSEGLITEPENDDMAWQVITDLTKPRQAFYNPGIAAAFLGRYHMATQSPSALTLARSFLDLTVQGTEAQFDFTDSVQVCKFAWGASVLLEATGEQQFLDHCLRMAGWFIAAQNEDGSWNNSPFLMARGGDPESIRVEVTAEFVQHMMTLLNAVSGHPRTGD